jgi:hypothetical protein
MDIELECGRRELFLEIIFIGFSKFKGNRIV